jgi:putative FmdB family regulatory protein
MPRYEYRCRECGATFELTRPMAASGAPADCPDGHGDTVKLLSTVAVGRGSAVSGPSAAVGAPSASAGGGGGGCCGGGCCG